MKKIIRYEDTTYYNVDDKYHRVGLPAINYCNGSGLWSEAWYFNNKCHKINGSFISSRYRVTIYCMLYSSEVKINTEKLVI